MPREPNEVLVEVVEAGTTTSAVGSAQPGKVIWLTGDCVQRDQFPVDTATLSPPAEAGSVVRTWMTTATFPEGNHLESALDGPHPVRGKRARFAHLTVHRTGPVRQRGARRGAQRFDSVGGSLERGG